ncbi:glyceraldehyde 3-phosphate dehydrogenase NAD-binding domain-containing protein [Nocardiopsis flavescens]|uniref:glyceraldehyde 3-phosphate dehydrogenase NAD-binding domain-containing protein n=1 Tax=Nocardiopsis flavescens TaxID=758803 RepID=UPI00365EE13D
MRIGINGLGRIGRALFRVNRELEGFRVPVINEAVGTPKGLAYLLNFDSTYGPLPEPVTVGAKTLLDRGRTVALRHHKHLDDVAWDEFGVDVVVDASGALDAATRARRLLKCQNGVKKVILTNAVNITDYTLVLGANDDGFDIARHNVISSSTCDATAIAPVLKLIIDAFSVHSAVLTTVHPALSYQNYLDGHPRSTMSGDFALGRSIQNNVIAKNTSAASAVCNAVPGLPVDRILSLSYRVPTAIVSSADITVFLERSVSLADIESRFHAFEESQIFRILSMNDLPLVSTDFIKNNYSAIIDRRWLQVAGGNVLKIVLWYDNEWGYASRVFDQIMMIGSLLVDSKAEKEEV